MTTFPVEHTPLPPDVTDPVERVIARFYRSIVWVPADQFRSWALESIKSVIPHDAALWGSGMWEGRRFHTLTLSNLPAEYGKALEKTVDTNPLPQHMVRNQVFDQPTTMEDVLADEQFFNSPLYESAFKPFNINRILSTIHVDRRSGISSLVTLYRSDRSKPFTEAERQIQKRLVFHLFNASSHAFFIHAAKALLDRPNGASAAVVDPHGQLHDVQPRFLDYLDQHYPGHQLGTEGRPGPGNLPFELPDVGDLGHAGRDRSLCVKTERLGDMLLVYIWPAGPLDRLTLREREIVVAVAHGLSFKQAARKIGVAPSTVANHLYRIYRKLNVNSRTELADLIHEVPE